MRHQIGIKVKIVPDNYKPYKDTHPKPDYILWSLGNWILGFDVPLLKVIHTTGFRVAYVVCNDQKNHWFFWLYKPVGFFRADWHLTEDDIKQLEAIRAYDIHHRSDVTWLEITDNSRGQ